MALRALMRAIDRFSLKHRRFGIRNLMLYIVIGSAAVFLLTMMDTTYTVVRLIAFDPALILRGQIWRLITWIFYPSAGGIFRHVAVFHSHHAVLLLLHRLDAGARMGYVEVQYLLPVRHAYADRPGVHRVVYRRQSVDLNAGFLNLSMFFAFAVFYPEQRVMLFFFIPIKIKWLALVDAAFFLISIIGSLIAGNYFDIIVPIAAVVNFFIFCFDDLMHLLRPYRARASGQAINFRRAAKKQKKEEAARPYRHKCSVCGRTDTEYPDLEFRYCSKCNGYHAFCIDHINNHVHFK
jgi:hypothetical protein